MLTPRSCVVGIDTTFFGEGFGVTIFRDVTNNVILYWVFVKEEHINSHIKGIEYLKSKGINILGFVLDGFWTFYVRYGNQYPVQMCQKHMKDIVRRYITNKPQLEASKELKELMKPFTRYEAKTFDSKFNRWRAKWTEFLKEKSYLENGKWVFTHDRLRSAVSSLIRYRPYLFTYQENIFMPNTNNSIEGFNSGLKSYISIHRGLRGDRKAKLIHYYLKIKTEFKWEQKPTQNVN